MALARLLYEFAPVLAGLVPDLLPAVLLLLRTKAREVIKSVLGFIKVGGWLPREGGPLLQSITIYNQSPRGDSSGLRVHAGMKEGAGRRGSGRGCRIGKKLAVPCPLMLCPARPLTPPPPCLPTWRWRAGQRPQQPACLATSGGRFPTPSDDLMLATTRCLSLHPLPCTIKQPHMHGSSLPFPVPSPPCLLTRRLLPPFRPVYVSLTSQVVSLRLPSDDVAAFLPQVLEGILLWAEDSKNKFRAKVGGDAAGWRGRGRG